MLPMNQDDCDDCVPDFEELRRGLLRPYAPDLGSTLLFGLTFFTVAIFSWQKLYPRLAGQGILQDGPEATKRGRSSSGSLINLTLFTDLTFDRAAALAFSITVALSTVLAELMFCEITNLFTAASRASALTITITSLLLSLILITPALEIHSIVHGTHGKLIGSNTRITRFGLFLEACGLGTWLFLFWWIGRALIPIGIGQYKHSFREECLERIAIFGIASMASLAGFAAISSIWQTFGIKPRQVLDSDIARKEAGLNATSDLIATKESRLRALERKISDAPQASILGRVVGSIRGTSDALELSSVKLEISGLEAMRSTLATSVHLLRTRRQAQKSSTTPIGRICVSASQIFSIYCLYRIAATFIAIVRRWWMPTTNFADTDPINKFLTLIAKHIDPSLDRVAWSHQISFLLSGVMLLASFNAVLQTVFLLSRFMPARVLHLFHQTLALLVSQISATYVVSSALLLRNNLPSEMGGMIESALGASNFDANFMQRWFEGWFLGTCVLTTIGIWIGRKIVGTADWEEDLAADDFESMESGKTS